MKNERRAIVLLSGGLDSTTVLYAAHEEGFEIHALTFRYGQRHQIEIDAARRITRKVGVESHIITEIDLTVWGGSALTGDIEVPKDGVDDGIPATYVPARNTIFLSHALGFAEAVGATDIFIGVNAVDYSGYPDCRKEFIDAFEELANIATKAGVEGKRMTIHAPLLQLSKVEIIRKGLQLGVDYSMTFSCYDPDVHTGTPCGACDACRLRDAAFAEIEATKCRDS